MNFLDLIPGGAMVRWIVLGVALSAIAGAFGWFVHHERDIGRDEIRAQWAVEKDAQKTAALAAADANAKETTRRLAAQQEANHVHETELAKARADARIATAAVARLRDTIAALSGGGGSPGNPAVADVSTPAARVGTVAQQAVDEYRALAEVARLGQLAGNECSARYDALSVKP